MIVHVGTDVAQEGSCGDRHDAEGDGGVIHIFVRLGVGDLARLDDDAVGGLVARDAGDQLQLVQQRRSGDENRIGDVGEVRDAQFQLHGPAYVMDGVGLEFVEENVVIYRISDAATWFFGEKIC